MPGLPSPRGGAYRLVRIGGVYGVEAWDVPSADRGDGIGCLTCAIVVYVIAATWSALGVLAVVSISFLLDARSERRDLRAAINKMGSDMNARFDQVNARIDQTNARIDQQSTDLRAEMTEMRTIVISTNGRLDTLIERVANLESHHV